MSENKELIYCLLFVSLTLSVFIPVLLLLAIPMLLCVILDYDNADSKNKTSTTNNSSISIGTNKAKKSLSKNLGKKTMMEAPKTEQAKMHDHRWGVEGEDFEFGPDGKKYKIIDNQRTDFIRTDDEDIDPSERARLHDYHWGVEGEDFFIDSRGNKRRYKD